MHIVSPTTCDICRVNTVNSRSMKSHYFGCRAKCNSTSNPYLFIYLFIYLLSSGFAVCPLEAKIPNDIN
jgi:hypothetical protein